MGSRAFTLIRSLAVVAACAWLSTTTARADECLATTRSGDTFDVCFDPGNRVYLSAASDGLGLGLDVRHTEATDDPDVYWRLEHSFASVVGTRAEIEGTLYAGRFMRHSRDGHILLPTSPPRKIFVPFDVGAAVRVGRVERRFSDDHFDVNAIRASVFFEFTRDAHFRRRLAVGPVTRWDMVVAADLSSVDEHRVTPFSAGVLDAYLETADGLLGAGLRVEAGGAWSNQRGWGTYLDAEARLERVVIAINDRPVSLYASAGHERGVATTTGSASDESGHWRAAVGVRLAHSWTSDDR